MTTQEILEAARSAKSALALADNTARNAALLGMQMRCAAQMIRRLSLLPTLRIWLRPRAHQRCDAGSSGPDRSAH